jgi:hypothetical protein
MALTFHVVYKTCFLRTLMPLSLPRVPRVAFQVNDDHVRNARIQGLRVRAACLRLSYIRAFATPSREALSDCVAGAKASLFSVPGTALSDVDRSPPSVRLLQHQRGRTSPSLPPRPRQASPQAMRPVPVQVLARAARGVALPPSATTRTMGTRTFVGDATRRVVLDWEGYLFGLWRGPRRTVRGAQKSAGVDHAGGNKAVHFAVTLSPNQGAANGALVRRFRPASGRLWRAETGREAGVVRGSTGQGERSEQHVAKKESKQKG